MNTHKYETVSLTPIRTMTSTKKPNKPKRRPRLAAFSFCHINRMTEKVQEIGDKVNICPDQALT